MRFLDDSRTIRFLRADRLFLSPLLAAAAVGFAHAAHASGGEDAASEHGAHVANWWVLTGPENAHAPALGAVMITFALFVGIVYWVGKRPFQQLLQSRHDEVKAAIEEARRAKDEAEAKKREYEERLAKLDDEVAKLKGEFEARGKAEAERLRELGRAAAERIAKDAEDTIAADVERAREELKAEAARLALQLAEERIKTALTADDEKRLRANFLSSLAN